MYLWFVFIELQYAIIPSNQLYIIGENEETTSESMTVNKNIILGDCVEVTNEPYKVFYAIVIGSS